MKHSLLVFLSGVVLGVSLSPFAMGKPKQAILSPVAVGWAEEAGSGTGQVLGANTESVAVARKAEFRKLLRQQDLELVRVEPSTKKDLKGFDPQQNIETQPSVTREVTVAVYGDSMVDTMGTDLPYLLAALKKFYPNARFNLLNYGIGAQNVEKGLSGFNQPYNYKDRAYPSIIQSGAEIMVIESFAYNPPAGGEEGLAGQEAVLSQMISQAQASGAKVLLLSTIAPSRLKFGQGPGGVNWPPDQAWEHAGLIGRYLASAVNLGKNLNLPVVDAYDASLGADGEGNLAYISENDHIHPSEAGHQFVANLIARKIFQLGWVR